MQQIVLCGANAVTEKFYFNPDFSLVPATVQEELRTICVLYTAEFGCTLLMTFNEDGDLELQVVRDEGDIAFDEIGAEYKIREIQRRNRELFSQLEEFYRAFVKKEGQP